MMRGRAPLLFALGVALVMHAGEAVAGDVERGRAVFGSKHCAQCHRARGEQAIGPPVEELRRPQGAFELAGRLWNHVPAMLSAARQTGIEWPEISRTEMDDLMAYLRADAARDPAADLGKGQATLVKKGCLKCHSVKGEGARIGPALEERGANYESAVAWAAKMWVHTPRMVAKAREVGVFYPRFVDDEMDHLVAYLRSVAK